MTASRKSTTAHRERAPSNGTVVRRIEAVQRAFAELVQVQVVLLLRVVVRAEPNRRAPFGPDYVFDDPARSRSRPRRTACQLVDVPRCSLAEHPAARDGHAVALATIACSNEILVPSAKLVTM